MTQDSQYVIFASNLNIHAVHGFMFDNDLSFKNLKGCYKGVEEDSFIINIRDYYKVKEAGIVDGQESILILHEADFENKRRAQLLYLDNHRFEDIGKMQEVSENQARQEDAWSYRPDLDKYFICK